MQQRCVIEPRYALYLGVISQLLLDYVTAIAHLRRQLSLYHHDRFPFFLVVDKNGSYAYEVRVSTAITKLNKPSRILRNFENKLWADFYAIHDDIEQPSDALLYANLIEVIADYTDSLSELEKYLKLVSERTNQFADNAFNVIQSIDKLISDKQLPVLARRAKKLKGQIDVPITQPSAPL